MTRAICRSSTDESEAKEMPQEVPRFSCFQKVLCAGAVCNLCKFQVKLSSVTQSTAAFQEHGSAKQDRNHLHSARLRSIWSRTLLALACCPFPMVPKSQGSIATAVPRLQ